MWLDSSNNKTWTMLHNKEKSFLEVLDEQCSSVQKFLTQHLHFCEYGTGTSKVVLHRQRSHDISNDIEIYLDLANSQQLEKFVKEMVGAYKLKSIQKPLLVLPFHLASRANHEDSRDYMNKVFDNISGGARGCLRTYPSAQSPQPAEEEPDVAPTANTTGARTSVEHPSAFEADEDLATLKTSNTILYDGMPMPTLVQNLPFLKDLVISRHPNEDFPLNFLRKTLGGLLC